MAKVESTDGDQQHKQQEAENGSRDGGHVMSRQTGMNTYLSLISLKDIISMHIHNRKKATAKRGSHALSKSVATELVNSRIHHDNSVHRHSADELLLGLLIPVFRGRIMWQLRPKDARKNREIPGLTSSGKRHGSSMYHKTLLTAICLASRLDFLELSLSFQYLSHNLAL